VKTKKEKKAKKEKPEKAAKSSVPAKKKASTKEGATFREGTAADLLIKAMGKKPQTHNQIVEAAGLTEKGTFYDHLNKITAAGYADRVEDSEGKFRWAKAK
jgi:hypothetical protein